MYIDANIDNFKLFAKIEKIFNVLLSPPNYSFVAYKTWIM